MPGPTAITSVEVGVEDGDPAHYTLLQSPQGWGMSIHSTPTTHDLGPTSHAAETTNAGTCPFVLRFSKEGGQSQTTTFELGYSYSQPAGFHDAHWKASDGRQAQWGFTVGTGTGPVHSPARRNVLVFVLDDVGTDKVRIFDDPAHVGVHPFALTPNLEALATEGLKFTNFYVNPVCTTTRACIQTGRYAFRHGLGYFADANVLVADDCEVTLAELLKGGFPSPQLLPYATAAFGKWHLSHNVRCNYPYQGCCTYEYPTYLYLCNPAHPVRNGYDHFSGTLANTGDHFNDWIKFVHDAGFPPVEIVTPPDDCTVPACAAENWTANILRADATEWIQDRTTPFFAYVAFNPPHAFYQVPPLVTEDSRPLLDPDTQGELADHFLDPLEGPGPDDPINNPNYFAKLELISRAMLEAVDSEIGYLLEDIGEKADNTVIFVVCDNGTPEGVIFDPPHENLHGKTTVYQIGTRVPMLVKGPLIPPSERGGACSGLVGAVDLWRTIAEITGADESAALNGFSCPDPGLGDSVSFLPLLLNPNGAGPRPYAFSQGFSPNLDITQRCKHERALTDGTFKYIRKQVLQCGVQTYDEELYNILDDPEEGTNLLNGTLTQEQDLAYQDLLSQVTSATYGGD